MSGPKLEAVDFDPFAGAELVSTGASTEAQRELWTASQLGDDASCAFNESVSLVLEGTLDVEAMNLALGDLTQRHESLRMTFAPDGASFVVAQSVSSAPRREDFSGKGASEREAALAKLKVAEVETAFDLGTGPLCRFVLITMAPDRHVLIITAHHVVCDGWSLAVMLADLGKLYTARKNKTEHTAKPVRFSDYAAAQAAYEKSPDYAADEAFWMKQFSVQPDPLELPLDRARPKVKTYASRRIDHVLDAQLVDAVKKLGSKSSTSFFTTLLAGFGALLHRLTHQDEVVIAIPSAGQSATGMLELVGHCVNALPLRFATQRAEPAATLLSRVRGVMLDAVEHQRLTFGSLVKKLGVTRDPSRLPLVSVLFNVDQAIDGDKLGFAGLRASFASNPRHYENFEIFINAAEYRGVLTLECQYNTDLFDDATIRRWLASYETMLRDWTAHADRTVGALDIGAKLTRDETQSEFPLVEAHALVFAQADRTPNAVAVVQGSRKLTYKELADRARSLADVLVESGVGDETIVGIHLNRTPEMVVAVLAVQEAGGAYVPLDPAFPAERLQFMIADSKAPVVITESALAHTFVDVGVKQLLVDKLEAKPPKLDRPKRNRPEALAYVLYTSGSTGKPKGVAVPHRALVNFLVSMQKEPGLKATDRLLAVTTLSFDIAGLELFLPLITGARVVLATKEQTTDGAELVRLINDEGVTYMQATPSTWRLLLATGWTGNPAFTALCGGEAVSPELARDVGSKVGALWNMYGPTETTIWSTCAKLAPNLARVTLGPPIANTRLYVLDADRQPVLPGIVGELYIAGDGVAREYLGRPDLTAERFLAVNGERAYRTGDLVRRHANGHLEFIGRADTQIKLRGFRIELGEIESAMRAHPDVDDAVAIVREDRQGDPRLVGYIVAKREIAADDMRHHLGKTLPEYMRPQVYVRLEAFPLTPNNKVDRKRLPAPSGEQESKRAHIEPQTELEKQVAAIFGDVLGMTKVSAEDNFFHLGGHSLLAAHVVSRLARDLKVAVPMRRIFESPTVKQLAAGIEAAKGASTQVHSVPRGSDQSTAPLTPMQMRVWFAEQMDPGTAVFNLPSAFRIKGKFDAEAMQKSLQALVDRHSTLRTRFETVGDAPVQRIVEHYTLEVPLADLVKLPQAEREATMLADMQRMADTPIDTTKVPMVVTKLFRLAADEHVLYWMPHHAIWDGWSFDVFLEELDQAYTAFAKNEPPPWKALTVSYADFARWQTERLTGPELTRQTEYWKRLLKAPLPTLELATDKPRPAQFDFVGLTEPFLMSNEEVDNLTAMARRYDATLYMTLLAGFAVLLHRVSEGDDLVIGTPVRGRGLPEIDGLLGFFVNTLALRLDLSGNPSFGEVLHRVRAVVLDAFSNQDMPFDALVKDLNVVRDRSRTPVYQSFFTFQDVRNRGTSFGGTGYDQIHVHAKVTPTDLSFWVKQFDQGIVGGLDYATSIFDGSTMKRLLDELRTLLASAAASPDTPIGRLELLPAAERAQLERWNATAMEYPQTLAHQLVFAQAKKTPDSVAIVQGDQKLTYAQLAAKATKLSDVLVAAGVKDETLVGIHLNRTIEMVVAILGVQQAGGAYVPLDPAFPAERLQFMLDDSKAPVVVTERALVSTFAKSGARQILVDDLENAPPASRTGSAKPDALAYVLYTSGSTGKPKGVAVSHRALVNFLSTMEQTPGLDASDALLAVTTLSFDIAGLELFLPLTIGARIVLATKEQAMDGHELARLIREHQVTVMQATPTTWRLLLQTGFQHARFKALCGGEALSPELGRELAGKVGELWNMYGPTETTIWSTCSRVLPGSERISIGKPIGNTTCFVVDPRRELVPIGVLGELYIGGAGVAREYLNRPDLTAERFVTVNGTRAYRTGDVVRWEASGELTYVRRNDTQVKLRGYRIELGEIESALRTHPDIQDAVCMVREDRQDDARLVGYLVSNREIAAEELRVHLGKTLPEYMQPQVYARLDAFPLTPNNKVDRKRLPAPSGFVEEPRMHIEPATPLEHQIAAIFGDILGLKQVSATENFFHMGGHSLLAAHVVSRLNRDLKIAVPMRRIFDAPTVQQLAATISGEGADIVKATSIARAKDQELAPLTAMQQRIWFVEQMAAGTTVYNLPLVLRLRGEFNANAMQKALQALVDRQPSLRTTLAWVDGVPMQRVAPTLSVDAPIVDLSGMPAPQAEATMVSEMHSIANVPLDITKAPLFSTKMYKLGSVDHVLFWMPHHLIWDGWSFDIFLAELDQAYTALAKGKEPNWKPLPVSYVDFTHWHRDRLGGPELAQQTEYWKRTLKAPLPVLELAVDKARPATFDFIGLTEEFEMSSDAVDSLVRMARKYDATLYMTLLAAFAVLLHRLSGADDVVVGTPVRGRGTPELDDVLGFFVNTLALRVDLSGEPTFGEVLRRTRNVVLDAFSNQDMPFDALVKDLDVKRDNSRTPVYQSFFTFQDVRNRGVSFGGTPYEQVHVHTKATPTDLSFWVKQEENGIVGGIDYASSLYEGSTIARMLDGLQVLLASVAAEPEKEIGRLDIVPKAERQQLERWNATKMDYPRALAHQLVFAQAQRTPDAVAISQGAEQLTYAQLTERVKMVADVLAVTGVQHETLVGVHLNRTIDMVVAILAVHEAGGAYVPLDPAFPAERLQFMVQDSKAQVVITEKALGGTFAQSGAKQVMMDDLPTVSPVRRQTRDDPETLAYVLYTSGSTGKPKGVAVPHRALVNFLSSMQKTPGLKAGDRLLAVTTLSFDIAGLELFLPLTVGARVVLATKEQAGDGSDLARIIRDDAINVMQATPTTWRLLLQTGFQNPHFKALCGGEALPPELGRELASKVGELWNMYGPTETTIWSTCSRVRADSERISIGKPIGNTTCFVVDPRREVLPIGAIGELYIGGDGVAREYLNRPDLTAERFVTIAGTRVYRTGDLVRWEANGELTYMRRNDTQVKVRGYRIELGEIESALRAHPAAEDAVASVREDYPGDVRLVGYVIHKKGAHVTDSEMRKHLRATLPDYMVPQHFVQLDSFPLTPNGKVDRKRLPAPFANASLEEQTVVPPVTPSEKLVAAAYVEALSNPRVGLHDNFFELGGHSLLCLTVIARIEKETGKRLSPRVVLRDSLQQVAAALDSMAAESVVAPSENNASRKGLFGKLFGR